MAIEDQAKQIRSLIAIIALLVVVLLVLLFIFVFPQEGKTKFQMFGELAKGMIPNAIVALLAALFVYFQYIRGLTPEQELRKAIRHSLFIDDIRLAVARLSQTLEERSVKPDIIISFNRTGGVAAGMLAVQKERNIERVMVIPRAQRIPPDGNIRYKVGEPISQLDNKWFVGKTVLIVAFLVDTWETINDGVEFLKNRGVDLQCTKILILSIFATSRATQNPPSIGNFIYAIKDDNARQKYMTLPWVLEEYGYV